MSKSANIRKIRNGFVVSVPTDGMLLPSPGSGEETFCETLSDVQQLLFDFFNNESDTDDPAEGETEESED